MAVRTEGSCKFAANQCGKESSCCTDEHCSPLQWLVYAAKNCPDLLEMGTIPSGWAKTMIAGWARIVSGDPPQKNCPGYSQDSETSIIIGEAVAPPQLSLYK